MLFRSLEAELIEIDENLCRAELTASQRAQAIKRRRQIWEALHPGEEMGGKTLSTHQEKDALGRSKSPQQEQQFAASTAAAAGMTKQAINQHLARAEALGDDLERITGKEQTGNVAELLAAQALCWCWPRWVVSSSPRSTCASRSRRRPWCWCTPVSPWSAS